MKWNKRARLQASHVSDCCQNRESSINIYTIQPGKAIQLSLSFLLHKGHCTVFNDRLEAVSL